VDSGQCEAEGCFMSRADANAVVIFSFVFLGFAILTLAFSFSKRLFLRFLFYIVPDEPFREARWKIFREKNYGIGMRTIAVLEIIVSIIMLALGIIYCR
jgi:hypothetical protein